MSSYMIAAGKSIHNKENTQFFTRDCEPYFNVNFKMYLHFNSLQAVTPTEIAYTGSVYAPIKNIIIKPIVIPANTLVGQYSFSLKNYKCPKGPADFVEKNLLRFTGSAVWDTIKEKLINDYLKFIENKYNIILEKRSLDYTTQYCWEIQ